ncbi:MAG: PIN domain-containing protein [Acidobacteriota bacterium]
MTGKVFVDTNVLVYTRDSSEAGKQEQAEAWMRYLWKTRDGCLSLQVLHEFYVTVTRKLSPGLNVAQARGDVRALLSWEPQPLNAQVLEAAWNLEDRHSLSWWDALIVAAAQVSVCRVLLTEDLQEGRNLDGVRVVNPFLNPPPGR